MDISAVGNFQVMPVTPHERPADKAHPVGTPIKGFTPATPQANQPAADEKSGVKTEVRRNSEVGINVMEFRDAKTGEIIHQLPSRQILAMAINLAHQINKKETS
ncbi:MAG: hypothetical protein ACSLFB_13580 [Acidimicrobiales bacterium]